MEKEYLYINKNKDMAEYKETYSDERTLSFMCNKCYNIHPIIVKQEYICHNKTTVVARNGENFEEELNVDVNDVGYKTSIFTIPTTGIRVTSTGSRKREASSRKRGRLNGFRPGKES
jgi:hypothetical protein